MNFLVNRLIDKKSKSNSYEILLLEPLANRPTYMDNSLLL